MINKSPTNLDKFPVPVTGQEIPKGWFARLVSFINSLVLHGDGQYLAVSHNMSGTTIKPTPALLQLASARGAAPSSGGGSVGFPDFYSSQKITVVADQAYQLMSPMWLIGKCGGNAWSQSSNIKLSYFPTGSSTSPSYMNLFSIGATSGTESTYFENFICIPLASGLTVSISEDTLYIHQNLVLYPCL